MNGGLLALAVAMCLLTISPFVPQTANAYAGETIGLGTACINGNFVDINGGVSPGQHVTSISWDWGDTTTTTGFFPEGHVYASGGTYTIMVTAFFDDLTSISISTSVTVPAASPTNCLALTIASGSGGSVSYSSDAGSGLVGSGSSKTIYIADTASLAATPKAGFMFTSWTLTGSVFFCGGGGPSSSTTVCGQGAVTANFTPMGQVPEFPFGVTILFGLLVPALLLARKRIFSK